MRLVADARGTASLEFAVAGVVITMLTLAIFDVGLLFMAQRGLDHGVNQAARWAAVNSQSLSVASVLSQFQAATAATIPDSGNCVGYAAGANADPVVKCSIAVGFNPGTAPGGEISIQASYRWLPVSPVTGFRAAILQSSVKLGIQH